MEQETQEVVAQRSFEKLVSSTVRVLSLTGNAGHRQRTAAVMGQRKGIPDTEITISATLALAEHGRSVRPISR
jgi:hypothetical protein